MIIIRWRIESVGYIEKDKMVNMCKRNAQLYNPDQKTKPKVNKQEQKNFSTWGIFCSSWPKIKRKQKNKQMPESCQRAEKNVKTAGVSDMNCN